jgi:hypothetical protein
VAAAPWKSARRDEEALGRAKTPCEDRGRGGCEGSVEALREGAEETESFWERRSVETHGGGGCARNLFRFITGMRKKWVSLASGLSARIPCRLPSSSAFISTLPAAKGDCCDNHSSKPFRKSSKRCPMARSDFVAIGTLLGVQAAVLSWSAFVDPTETTPAAQCSNRQANGGVPVLSPAHLATLQRDGIVVLKCALSPSDVALARNPPSSHSLPPPQLSLNSLL